MRLTTSELENLRAPPKRVAPLARYIARALVEMIVGWLERPTRQHADELIEVLALTRKLLA